MKQRGVFAFALVFLAALLSVLGGSQVSSAARVAQVTTSTVTLGASTSLVSLEQVWNGPFTVLSTTGTSLPCEFWALNFTANTGQYLSGMFNSDTPVSFFVVPQATYQSWVRAGTCGNAADAIASQLIATSYSFSAIAIPSSGTWTIVIVNGSNLRNADGYLLTYLSTNSYTVTQPLTGTITMTSTSTSTAVSGQPVPGFPVAAIVLGIVVGLVAVVIIRRRNQR